MKQDKEETIFQEESKIKLFLEASLKRKVNYLNIKNINKGDKSKIPKEEISYNVWIYSHEFLKETMLSYYKGSEFNPKIGKDHIKVKLGSIIINDLNESAMIVKKHLEAANPQILLSQKENTNDKLHFAILAQAYIGSSNNKVIDEDPRVFNSSITFGDNSTDVIYLNSSKIDSENKSTSTYHWFVFKDFSKLVFHSIVIFSFDDEVKKCSNVNCSGASPEMKYCYNDQKYFCSVCIEETHNKTTYNTLRKHHIVDAIDFSINYTNNCSRHPQKLLEYFCYNCNAMFCTKCFDTTDVHPPLKFNPPHEIKFITDVFNSFTIQMNALSKRVIEMVGFIDDEVEIRKATSKEILKLYNKAVAELDSRKSKAHDDLDNEINFRATYLASISVEIQRIINEIDSKISFLKHQYEHADQSTYIAMSNQFTKYMREELIPNLELLCEISFEKITVNLYYIEKRDNENMKGN